MDILHAYINKTKNSFIYWGLTISFSLLHFYVYGQYVYGPSKTIKDELAIEHLKGLCKVWGFLVYYGNNIDTNRINWNNELSNVLPLFTESMTDNEYNDQLLKLIEKANNAKNKRDNKTTLLYKRQKIVQYNNLRFDWIDTTGSFNDIVKQDLHQILQDYKPRKNYYISRQLAFLYQPKIISATHAQGVDTFTYQKTLLAFFELWNVFYYTYPYNDMVCMNYDSMLAFYIPSFYAANTWRQYASLCQNLLSGLCDSHANSSGFYLIGGQYTAPINVIYLEGNTVINEVADSLESKYHLRGCIITSIDGVPIKERRDFLKNYLGASREDVTERNVDLRILTGWMDTYLNLTVIDSMKTEHVIQLIRNVSGHYDIDTSTTMKFLNDSVCYSNIINYKHTDRKIFKHILASKYLILDFRCFRTYINNVAFNEYIKKILSKPPISFVELPSQLYPGKFYGYKQRYRMYKPHGAYKGRIIILINSNTQSSNEFIAEYLKQNSNGKVMFIGSNTAGACGSINTLALPYNMYVTYTGCRIYFPTENTFERIGLCPDIYIEPSLQGITSGRDEVLERALMYIENK